MTAISHDALEQALALNRRQEQLVHDPSPEIDSLAEVMRELFHAHDIATVKRLVGQGIHMLADLRHHNHAERGHIETAVMPAMALPQRVKRGWTVKSLTAAVRDPLGDLLNPAMADLHAKRRAEVQRIVVEVVEAGCADLLAGSIEKELRGAKFGLLSEIASEVVS